MTVRIQRPSKPIPPPDTFDNTAAGGTGVATPATTPATTPAKNLPQGEQLLALIPGGAAALYLGGKSLIPRGNLTIEIGWLAVGLIAAVLVAANQKDPQAPNVKLPTEWNQVIVSVGAFIIWAYALGGPFDIVGIYQPSLAGLLVLAYTFFAPYILQGLDRTNA